VVFLATEELEQALRYIEDHYELGSGFLIRLYKEDDWSFVIKAHALIEAAASQLLAHQVGDHRLSRIFERLELSNDQTGRVAFLKALGLLNDRERRFVRSLSELRNRLVHNVHNVRFRFADEIATMAPNQRRAFMDWATFFADPGLPQNTWRETALTDPKRAIWFAALMLVGACLTKTNEARYRARADRPRA